MDPRFREVVDSLDPKLRTLLAMPAATTGKLPKDAPNCGVYLFSERGEHLYVGRSRNIPARYCNHWRPASRDNAAVFAMLLARKSVGAPRGNYRPGNLGSGRTLMQNPEFLSAFAAAKARVKAMEFRYVEETDPTRQALLEIYCAFALGTSYNDFDTH